MTTGQGESTTTGQESAGGKGEQQGQGQEPTEEHEGNEPGDGGEGDEKDVDPKVRKANREAAKYRKELRDAQAKVAELEKSQLSDSERLQKERDEAIKRAEQAEARAQRASVTADITALATELRFRNPGLAYKLVELDEVEFDENGKAKGLRNVLKELVKENPYLVSGDGGGGDAGDRGKGPSGGSMNDLIRQASGRA